MNEQQDERDFHENDFKNLFEFEVEDPDKSEDKPFGDDSPQKLADEEEDFKLVQERGKCDHHNSESQSDR